MADEWNGVTEAEVAGMFGSRKLDVIETQATASAAELVTVGAKDMVAGRVQHPGITDDLQPRRAPHVLVADDEPCLTAVIAEILSREGYRVTAVHDGVAALRAAVLDRPTVVLSDIRMPGGDGFTMLRLFRRESTLVGVPIIFFSSAPDERRALHMGAYGFIRKPVGAAELLQGVFEGVCAGFMGQEQKPRSSSHQNRLGLRAPTVR